MEHAMNAVAERIWAGTDFPCQCLIDRGRTAAFRETILGAMRPGSNARVGVRYRMGTGPGTLRVPVQRGGNGPDSVRDRRSRRLRPKRPIAARRPISASDRPAA